MKAVLWGGRFDGTIVDLEATDLAPFEIQHWAYTTRETKQMIERDPDGKIPPVTYRRTSRTRSDGCVIYVLKGASS